MPQPAPTYLRPYELAAEVHGGGFRTTLWNSPRTQRVRFQVISEMCPMSGQTIIDVGCGRADLLDYLIESGRPPRRYIGLDALAPMIVAAQAKGLPNAQFHREDFVANPTVLRRYQPAVLIYSGSLNTLRDKQFTEAIEAAIGTSELGVVFNFLSTRVGRERQRTETIARRHDPAEVSATVLAAGIARIELRHDYLGDHDCSIAAWKQ